jgi:hypothetical protein
MNHAPTTAALSRGPDGTVSVTDPSWLQWFEELYNQQATAGAKGFRVPVANGPSLPAASRAMDGQVLIEDGGQGAYSLVFYADGQRFRVQGTPF